jgi:hypothetical protein
VEMEAVLRLGMFPPRLSCVRRVRSAKLASPFLTPAASQQPEAAAAARQLLPLPRIAPTDADEDAFDAPGARFEFAGDGLRCHAAASDEVPNREGVIGWRAVGFAKHQQIELSVPEQLGDTLATRGRLVLAAKSCR